MLIILYNIGEIYKPYILAHFFCQFFSIHRYEVCKILGKKTISKIKFIFTLSSFLYFLLYLDQSSLYILQF